MNLYVLIIASIPVLYIAWIINNPLQAVSLTAELKRRYRRWIIKRHGEQAAQMIEKTLRAKAGKNLRAQKAVDIVMRQEYSRIVQQYGTQYANQSLGLPNLLERDF